jgi:hypothetical protein
MTQRNTQNEVCSAHTDFINMLIQSKEREAGMQSKLEEHGEMLKELVSVQRAQAVQIDNINRIVTNGLQSNITSIKDSLIDMKKDFTSFCNDTRGKIEEIEKFAWFRNAMNKFRDKFFWRAMTFLVLVIIFLALLHYSDVLPILFKIIRGTPTN